VHLQTCCTRKKRPTKRRPNFRRHASPLTTSRPNLAKTGVRNGSGRSSKARASIRTPESTSRLALTAYASFYGRYTYELCFFESGKQKSNKGHMSTTLGYVSPALTELRLIANRRFSSWHADAAPGSQEYYSRQVYDGGQKCWNGVSLPCCSYVINTLLAGTQRYRRYHLRRQERAAFNYRAVRRVAFPQGHSDICRSEKCEYHYKVISPGKFLLPSFRESGSQSAYSCMLAARRGASQGRVVKKGREQPERVSPHTNSVAFAYKQKQTRRATSVVVQRPTNSNFHK
jgi:hypothetical protein